MKLVAIVLQYAVGGAKAMLEAFLKGIAATVGGLLAYTLYDGIYTLCAWVRSKRNPPQTSKRKKKN